MADSGDDDSIIVGDALDIIPIPDPDDQLDILIGEELDITPNQDDDLVVGEGVNVSNPDDQLEFYPQKKSFWDRIFRRK